MPPQTAYPYSHSFFSIREATMKGKNLFPDGVNVFLWELPTPYQIERGGKYFHVRMISFEDVILPHISREGIF